MRRVLGNLFENAIAAQADIPDGEREISVRSLRDGDQVVIHFADRGPGVPDQIRDRIFEPHFTTKGSGMGLGLTLVGSVISLHGGAVSLLDAPGAVFRITLPLTDADRDDGQPVSRETQKEIS